MTTTATITETLTEKTNRLALQVQAQGTESLAFVELFELVDRETIQPKVRTYSKQLKGDMAEGISIGYMLLTEMVMNWKGEGSFHRVFTVAYTNRLNNLVRDLGRDVRKHNTSYEVSLSYALDEKEENDSYEVSYGSVLETSFDVTDKVDQEPTLEELLHSFSLKYPERYDLIVIMLGFTEEDNQATRTQAFKDYFCTQTYTSVLQKRVSRARTSFFKHLQDAGYDVSHINY